MGDNILKVYEPDIDKLNEDEVYNAKVINKELNKKASKQLFDIHIQQKNPHGMTAEDIDVFEKQEVIDLINETINDSTIESHISDKNNPHEVTAEQINVYTKPEMNTKISNIQTNIQDSKEAAISQAKEYVDDLIYFDDSEEVTGPSNKIVHLQTYKEDKQNKTTEIVDSDVRYPTSRAVKRALDTKVSKDLLETTVQDTIDTELGKIDLDELLSEEFSERLIEIEEKDTEQDNRLGVIESDITTVESNIDNINLKDINQDNRLDTIESGKQDKLTAGDNITLSNNIISANVFKPDEVTIVIKGDDKLKVSEKLEIDGGFL